jgi:hypothetical protein
MFKKILISVLLILMCCTTSYAYRDIHSDYIRNTAGAVVASATVKVYLAGTSTVANIYEALADTIPVASVTTGTDGLFTFYVDRFDYDSDQKFKIVATKDAAITTYDNVTINRAIVQTYTISADKTVSTNIKVPKGVIYSVASTKTLTLNGAIDAGLYQIFSGSGTVAFGTNYTKEAYPEWWGAIGDSGTTDNTTALNNALATGKAINLSSTGYYKITAVLTISVAATKLYSQVKSEIKQATANLGVIDVTASNISIRNVKLTGPQYALSKANEIGVHAYGTDSSNYITGLEVTDCEISTLGGSGILTKYVSDYNISNNYIYNIYSAGMSIQSTIRGHITGNNINNIIGTPNAYGIAFTRSNNDSLVTEPRSGYSVCANNIIRNVINWDALNTHGGEYIDFIGNVCYGNKIGADIGPAQNTAGTYVFAPLHINVVGNVFNSGITDGSAYQGIVFTGADDNQYATGSITGNTIIEHGAEATVTSSALYTYWTEGLTITGNSFINSGMHGIYINENSKGTSIVGNSFYTVWSDINTTPIGIRSVSGNNTLFISGNNFTKGDKSVTYSCVEAIRIGNVAGTIINIGQNFNNGYTRLLNDAGDKAMRGITGGLVTSGTGEDDLGTTTIKADTIGTSGRLRITASGTKTGANDNKTLKFYFGTSSVTFHAAANNTNDWEFTAFIDNYATNGQVITWTGWDGTTPLKGQEIWAIDTTADVVMKITGECSNAGDTVVQYIWNVEHL